MNIASGDPQHVSLGFAPFSVDLDQLLKPFSKGLTGCQVSWKIIASDSSGGQPQQVSLKVFQMIQISSQLNLLKPYAKYSLGFQVSRMPIVMCLRWWIAPSGKFKSCPFSTDLDKLIG